MMAKEPARTILITGASGSIGRKLRRHMEARDGHTLKALCINLSGDPEVISADLAEYDEHWVGHFAGVDTVIHLAGAAYSNSSWQLVQRLNMDLSLNVLRAAVHHKVRRIVFPSSNWVMAGYRYGTERLTTDLPPWPVNP